VLAKIIAFCDYLAGVKRNWPDQGLCVAYQAECLNCAKLLLYSCMSIISPLREKEWTLSMKFFSSLLGILKLSVRH